MFNAQPTGTVISRLLERKNTLAQMTSVVRERHNDSDEQTRGGGRGGGGQGQRATTWREEDAVGEEEIHGHRWAGIAQSVVRWIRLASESLAGGICCSCCGLLRGLLLVCLFGWLGFLVVFCFVLLCLFLFLFFFKFTWFLTHFPQTLSDESTNRV